MMTPDQPEMSCWCKGSGQSLSDLLNDPTVQQVMTRDGVTAQDLTDLFNAVRTRLIAERWRNTA